LEGVLRVFWGVQHSIRVKEVHDQRPIMRKKSSAGKNSGILAVFFKKITDLAKMAKSSTAFRGRY
jgi:glycerol-3-phosphate dehydrogenase